MNNKYICYFVVGMNIFVAFFVLLLLLADSTPPAASAIPLIGILLWNQWTLNVICLIYTVSQKVSISVSHNFVKYSPIFKILSLAHSSGNLQYYDQVVAIWLSGNVLVSINEVSLRYVLLVLRWMTVPSADG